MTQVVRFEMKHLNEIELREHDKTTVANIPHFRKWCEIYEKNRGAYTLLSPDGIICIAGVAPVWPGVGAAWSVTSDLVNKYPKAYFKATKQVLDAISADWKLHRVQVSVNVENKKAVNWVQHLGFQFEGLMRAYGVDKQDHYLYARVN